MPCLVCPAGTLCRHPSTSPTPGQLCADWTTRPFKPDFQSRVERDFARPHLPNNKSAQTHQIHPIWKPEISEETSPAASNSLHNAKAHTIYSNMCCFKKRKASPPTGQPAILGTSSEHFSASSRCHTSQKSGCVGPKGPMPCLVCLPLCRFWDHALQAP